MQSLEPTISPLKPPFCGQSANAVRKCTTPIDEIAAKQSVPRPSYLPPKTPLTYLTHSRGVI
jgi:hypothetical protein